MKKSLLFLVVTFFFISTDISAQNQDRNEPIQITVYRSPSCGCCGKWIQHLQQNNFIVEDILSDDMTSIKTRYGVPKAMESCHTAIVDGYVIEGHVPANDIIELLKTKPKVVGISVPGMVTGSPGMEMGSRIDPYDVVSFDKSGNTKVFNSYRSK